MTCFWNNLHHQKIGKPNNLKVFWGTSKSKVLSRIAKIVQQYLFPKMIKVIDGNNNSSRGVSSNFHVITRFIYLPIFVSLKKLCKIFELHYKRDMESK